MIQHVQKGQVISADTINLLIDAYNSRTLFSGGGFSGATSQAVPGDSTPLNMTPAYVYAVDSDVRKVQVRRAVWNSDVGWIVIPDEDSLFWVDIGPGFVTKDFIPFIVDTEFPELTDPSILLLDDRFALATNVSSAGFWAGKVIDINLHAQIALVAPIKSGVNPTGAQWSNSGSFDLEKAVCVWTMGFTGYQVRQPIIVFSLPGQPFSWAMTSWNLTGSDFARWCEPTGPFTPQTLDACEPPPDEPICDVGACCFENQCVTMTESACESFQGSWHGDETCGTIDPEVCPQFGACCLPNGDCIEINEDRCLLVGGIPQPGIHLCSDTDCEVPKPCCFLDGECDIILPSACKGAGGFPSEAKTCEDANCVDLFGCCFGIEFKPNPVVVFCAETTFQECGEMCPFGAHCNWCNETPCNSSDPCSFGAGPCP